MISRKEVEHLASLARIALTDAEKNKFEKDLSGILDFVAKLNEVDVSTVEPLSGGTELENVMRQDAAGPGREGDMGQLLLKAAPRRRGGFIEVPPVFKRQ